MPPLTTGAIPQELQTDAPVTPEQLTTSIMVLSLHAFQRTEEFPRIRLVFEQLLEVIHEAETEMGVYDLP
jgi:hypothetical protein